VFIAPSAETSSVKKGTAKRIVLREKTWDFAVSEYIKTYKKAMKQHREKFLMRDEQCMHGQCIT
jgi:hypothetical protein